MGSIKYILLLIGLLFILSGCGSSENQDREHEYLPDRDTLEERVHDDNFEDLDIPAGENTLSFLRKKILDEPGNPDWYYYRALYYHKNEQNNLAHTDLESAFDLDSSNPSYYLLKAQVSLELTLPTTTLETLEAGIKRFPENTDLLIKMAEYKLFLQQLDKSMMYANKAIEINPNIAKAYYIRGYNFKEVERIERAISSFETAVDLDPDYYEAHIELGLLNSSLGNDRAIHYFNNALRLRPESKEGRYARAKWYQDNNRYEEAIADYKKLLEQSPGHRQAHYNIAFVYLLSGENDEAADHFTKSIRIAPGHTLSYYGRGLAFRNLGMYDEAKRDFNKVLEMDEDFTLARQELSQLNQ